MKMIRLWLLPLIVAWPFPAAAASFEATLAFARKAELGLPVSGVVQSVVATAGMSIKRGQTLLALDETPFKAGVEQAEAEVARHTADRDETARDYRQSKELFDRAVLSAVELENAKLKATRTEARLKEARAHLTQARYALTHSVVLAPFDGWVIEVRAQAGQSVTSNLEARTLVVVAAQGEYLARVRVSGATQDSIKIGQVATVYVAGKSYPGRIQALSLEPVAGKGGSETLYEVGVAFTVPEVMLRAGQVARVELP